MLRTNSLPDFVHAFFNFFQIYFGSLIVFFRVKTLLDLVSDLPDEEMATVLRKEL